MERHPTLINVDTEVRTVVNNSAFSIGRSLCCDHIITSLEVSRIHCILKKNGEAWSLFDRSSNGTMVNSVRVNINDTIKLNDGDVIQLGTSELCTLIFHDPRKTTSASTSRIQNTADGCIEAAALLEGLEDEFSTNFPEPVKSDLIDAIVDDKPNISESKKPSNSGMDMIETEFTCSICSEVYIKAVTLGCSHTFCKFCVDQWRKKKTTCPICRNTIKSISPTLVLDNYIEKFLLTQSEEVRNARKESVAQRDTDTRNMATSSAEGTTENDSVIEIFSDYDEEESDYSDYNYMSDNDFEHDYFTYTPREPYYGGYGRCFHCNEEGHWANNCPLRPRPF